MINLLKTVVLAGVATVTIASAAFAGEYPVSPQQARAERSFEYWNKQNAESSNANADRQMAGTATKQKVSEYPCPNCIYDHQLGGYVQKNYGKR